MTVSRPPLYTALRRAVIQLAAAVLVLDGVCIGLYYALGVATWPGRRQYYFLGGWLLLTLLVVLTGLSRVRAARFGRHGTQPARRGV